MLEETETGGGEEGRLAKVSCCKAVDKASMRSWALDEREACVSVEEVGPFSCGGLTMLTESS